MKKLKNVIYIFISIIIFVACSSKRSVVLNDISCDGQCWKDIRLGDTDENIVINNLQKMSYIDKASIIKIYNSIPYNDKSIIGNFINVKETGFEISFYDNEVNYLYYYYDEDGIDLDNFIEKFGDPDQIMVRSVNIGEPKTLLIINIIYNNPDICLYKKISLIWPFDDPKTYKIKKHFKIENINLSSNNVENGHMKFGCLRGMDQREEDVKNYIQEWSGYGEYYVHREGFPFSNP